MSATTVPDIPGFYYDHERKRYFRIVNTGLATNHGTTDYSISAVAEIRRRNRRRINQTNHTGHINIQNHNHIQNLSHIQPGTTSLRKHLLTSSLGPRINRNSQNSMLIGGMKQRGHWNLELPTGDSLGCFLWYEKDQVLVTGSRHGICAVIPGSDLIQHSSIMAAPSAPNPDFCPIESFLSEVTSLTVSGKTIVHTCLGGPGSTGALGCTVMQKGIDGGMLYKLPERQSAFCSAAKEDSTGPNTRIAVGASSCAYCIQPDVTGFFKVPFQTGSDVFSVEFLGDNTGDYLLAAGCRNGSLDVFDPRLPTRHMTPTRPVIQAHHSSAITHIKSIQDDRYVLVSGLEDTLSLYDLRYITNPLSKKPSRPSFTYDDNADGIKGLSHTVASSRAVINYKGYSNLHTIRHGLAVDLSRKSFAIANDDGTINIYDIWSGANITGRALKDYVFEGSSASPSSAISGLQWTSTGGLFAGVGRTLEYWSLSKFEDDLRIY